METKLEVLLWWRVFWAQQKLRCTFACFSYAKQRRSAVKLSLDNSVIKRALPNAFNLWKLFIVNEYYFIFIISI